MYAAPSVDGGLPSSYSRRSAASNASANAAASSGKCSRASARCTRRLAARNFARFSGGRPMLRRTPSRRSHSRRAAHPRPRPGPAAPPPGILPGAVGDRPPAAPAARNALRSPQAARSVRPRRAASPPRSSASAARSGAGSRHPFDDRSRAHHRYTWFSCAPAPSTTPRAPAALRFQTRHQLLEIVCSAHDEEVRTSRPRILAMTPRAGAAHRIS